MPDDTALCFAKGISKLPLEVQFALQTLSCFGASVPCEIIHALESLNLKLVGPLQVASAQGLIVNLKGSYTFCHEVLQEVCYKMTEEQYRRGNHSMYGVRSVYYLHLLIGAILMSLIICSFDSSV